MKKVFLSYSHEDLEFARILYNNLITEDIDVWFEEKVISWGENLIDETQRALHNSSAVITIISSESKSSQWVAFEMGAAKAMGKKIIPILLAESYDVIPFHLKDIQVIEAKNKSINEVIRLILNELKKDDNYDLLTEREVEILKLIANGLTSYEIADKMNVSKRTVDVIRRNIMDKLNIKSLPKLISKAISIATSKKSY